MSQKPAADSSAECLDRLERLALIHMATLGRKVLGFAGCGAAVCLAGAALWASISSPISLALTAVEPGGVMDAAGAELFLAHVTVSNLQKCSLAFEWGRTVVECRAGQQWSKIDAPELLANPRFLRPQGTRELIFLLPAGATSCRMRLNYQRELFQWRLWHQFGARGQRFLLATFPSLSKRIWPQGNYGERPPWNKGFRIPPKWRSFTTEFAL